MECLALRVAMEPGARRPTSSRGRRRSQPADQRRPYPTTRGSLPCASPPLVISRLDWMNSRRQCNINPQAAPCSYKLPRVPFHLMHNPPRPPRIPRAILVPRVSRGAGAASDAAWHLYGHGGCIVRQGARQYVGSIPCLPCLWPALVLIFLFTLSSSPGSWTAAHLSKAG